MINPFFHDGSPAEMVAIRDGQAISRQRFLVDLAGAVQRLKPAAGGTGVLLTEDAYWGAVGLLAMAQTSIAVILPPNGQPATMEAFAGSVGVFVCDEEIASAGAGAGLSPKIVLDDTMAAALPGHVEFDPMAQVSFFTSGSSAGRKVCTKNFAHAFAEARALDRLIGDRAPLGCSVFGTVSHQHAYGFAFRMLWPLLSGRVIIGRMHSFVESLFHDLSQPAVVVSSPAHLARLDGIPPLDSAKVPHVLLNAGGRLEDAAAETAMRVFGVPVTDIYGSTEAGAMAFRLRDRANVLWQPLPGTIISPDENGALRAQADYIPVDGEINADRIEMHDDGRFTLLGRSDRIVKIEGKRVSLSEIERLLGRMAEVKEAVVVTFDQTEGLGAVVSPTAEGWEAIEKMGHFRFGRHLRAHLRQWIDPAGLPRRWRFLEDIPMDGMGKTSRADLARYFEAGSQ